MPLTLLHTADLHLGKSFSDLPPERAGQRRLDLMATLQRICREARERKVDLLCIAGDLFDRPFPSVQMLAAAYAALKEAAVPVLLLPGNHDPLDSGSPYLEDRWPGNVIVARKPGWQRLDVGGQEVWAFGYARGEAHYNPWPNFPGCGADALLALHAACIAPGIAQEAYYPFAPADIPSCAYLALGHFHRPLQVSRGPLAWYAGAPEPLEAETVPAAAMLIKLDGAATAAEPLDVATRHHRLVSIDVTGLTGEEVWQRALAAVSKDDLLTLKLTGLLDAGESLDLAALHDELLSKSCLWVEIDTAAMHLPADHRGAEGVLGALYQVADRRLAGLGDDDPGRQRVERALRYAALALEGKL